MVPRYVPFRSLTPPYTPVFVCPSCRCPQHDVLDMVSGTFRAPKAHFRSARPSGRVLLNLLILLLIGSANAAKKRRIHATVPAVPSEFIEEEHSNNGCPFHRSVQDTSPEELSEFGHELERDGRQAEALRCYAAAIRAHPTDARAWFDLAVARQDADPVLALNLYQHGVSLDPISFHYNQLGVMLRVAERHGEAAQRFKQASRLAPDDADPLFNLGGTYETLERYLEALHAYRGALDREKKNEARILNNIGNVLGHMGRWEDALAAYHDAEEADPDFPETQHNLAHVKEKQGKLDETAEHLRKAAKLAAVSTVAANYTERFQAAMQKNEERRKVNRQIERRNEINRRDGHLTREERSARFQEVLSVCGMDKACMKKMLKQEDAREDDLVVF